MGVPYAMVSSFEEFSAALLRESWSLVLSSYGLHDKIKQILDKPGVNFPGGKKPPLALMIEWGTEVYISNVRFVSLPIQSLSIANALNGKEDSRESLESYNVNRYTYPSARLLVVDDIPTNLKVTEGLLAPYEASVDTCLTGQEAIDLVKRNNYDIVFMDHMMPEMDGIEATEIIRAWEETEKRKMPLPIIALTANAVTGAREMFVEKGFNDFIAKPIDVSKLDEMVNRWIPKDKRTTGTTEKTQKPQKQDNTVLNIPGLDTAKGLVMTGGKEEGYRAVLATFQKDAHERMWLMQNALDAGAVHDFVIHVHALKSASASIGGAEVSSRAAALEGAGKMGDMIFIKDNLPVFLEMLTELVKNIHKVVEPQKAANQNMFSASADTPNSKFLPLFHELAEALKFKNASEIDRLIKELGEKPLDAKTREVLERISDDILVTEYDRAIKRYQEFFHGV
jgi:CheY-like chemotaxis protein